MHSTRKLSGRATPPSIMALSPARQIRPQNLLLAPSLRTRFGLLLLCGALALVASAEGNDVPFNFEIIVPLVIEKNEEGRREIVAIGEAVVENPDIELDASGGLLCGLFGAAQGAISDLLLQPFAGAIDELVATAREDLIGLEICE